MAKPSAKHVVVDTVAFFRNVPLQDITENVYTTVGVVKEIRDAATRQRLAVLPYDLKYQEPSTASMKTMSDFAKKTGDYRSLSAVDLKVLALAYQLTKEHCGVDHLKPAPEKKVTLTANARPLEKATDIVGFYLPSKNKNHSKLGQADLPTEGKKAADDRVTREQQQPGGGGSPPSRDCTEDQEEDSRREGFGDEVGQLVNGSDALSKEMQSCQHSNADKPEETVEISGRSGSSPDGLRSQKELRDDEESHSAFDGSRNRSGTDDEAGLTDAEERRVPSVEGEEEVSGDVREESMRRDEGGVEDEEDGDRLGDEDDDSEDDEEAEDEEEIDDNNDAGDEDGWITPKNISRIHLAAGQGCETAEEVTVGCMTADFAMQNVLIQIGIPVLSISGMLIKSAKSFVLRCRSCFKITSDGSKVFCPHCGNKTMDKVTMTTNKDGTQRIHLSRKKVLNKRGLKYPLPFPKGGKHADNPILVADQPVPQNRLSKKAQMKTDVFSPDYVVGTSPFAINDTTSKSAQLGVRSYSGNAPHHRRNPNQAQSRKGRRK